MHVITFSDYLKQTFGTKVYKLSLSSGCTCPVRDGTLGTGGCSFCSAGGSGDFAEPFRPVREQIAAAKRRVDAKFPHAIPPEQRRYIAYFQSYTNTYAPIAYLRSIYEETLQSPEIVALSIGTRSDCLGKDVLLLLSELDVAKVFIAMVPMMCVYPFLQRYFVTGVLLGAVKG